MTKYFINGSKNDSVDPGITLEGPYVVPYRIYGGDVRLQLEI
jgi:hypothetical protein